MHHLWLVKMMGHVWLVAMLSVVGSLASGDSWAADRDGVWHKRGRQILLAAETRNAQSVEMVVDYGDGVQIRFTALPWREKMTAFAAVTAASAHPHGVKFVWLGSGSTAFVTQIGDVKNEGGGKKSRNWLFSVNGEESEVGIGVCTLQPGDVVLWRFGLPDNNENAK